MLEVGLLIWLIFTLNFFYLGRIGALREYRS